MMVDLYDVRQRREELLGKCQGRYFAAWWPWFLARREEGLLKPAYPDIPGLAGMTEAAAYEAGHRRLVAASRETQALSFVYALTDDRRFAERAREIALRLCEDETPWDAPVHKSIYPELNADLSFATLCSELSASLGWLADALGEGDKRHILDTLAARGAVIHADALRGAWWGNAPNSNWTSHLMHGLGASALALLDDRPELARLWVELATERMRRMLDLATEEGAGIEGISYYMGCYASILLYGTELRNVTGESLFAHDFWRKCAPFPLYHTLPDLSGRTPVGDSHYPGLDGSVLLCGVAREARDGLAQWQAHRVLEVASAARISLFDLILYDPSLPETPPDRLPTCRVFHSVQVASFRSGWDRDAVYLHFHGGANSWSHCHLDLNSFTLDAYGERLAIDHGSWGYSPDYFRVVEPQISTAWHNTIVMDGADQRQAPRFRMSYDPREGGDCYAVLEDYLSCAGLEMIRGDATSAYGDMLDRFWREVIYLRPDRFIIYDNLLTNGARVQRHIQWLLHSEAPMAQVGEHVEVCGQKARLIIQPVFPTGWRARFPDRLVRARAIAGRPMREAHCVSIYPEWVHIWNESPANPPYPQWDARGGKRVYGPDYQYLVVLTPIRAAEEINWQLQPLWADGAEGVRIVAGDRVDTVICKRLGRRYALGEVVSDADKVVIREAGGRMRSLALMHGTLLRYKGQTVISEPQPVNRALDWAEGAQP
jgi:hypothetical protein